MFLVVLKLAFPATAGLVDGTFHRTRHLVGIQQRRTMQISGGTTDGLNNRPLGSQESFFVGIKNRDQRYLGHIKAFSQEIDAHQHIEHTKPQITNNFGSFDSADIRMQIPHSNTVLSEIVRQILGHSLGQGRDQNAFFDGYPPPDLGQHIINLGPGWPHLDSRIHEPGRPNQLFDRFVGMRTLIITRCCRHIYGLRRNQFEFVEAQRPVIQRRGQPEAVFDKGFLARPVATVHTAELRYGDMAFVDNQECVVRHVIEQARRRFTLLAARQVARVVLDSLAVTELSDHL